jgi:hypothetical protein
LSVVSTSMHRSVLLSALAAGMSNAYTVTVSELLMFKNIDPIVLPGQYNSHMHSIFGSDAITVNTTKSSELQKGCSTTVNPNDFSAYCKSVPQSIIHKQPAD